MIILANGCAYVDSYRHLCDIKDNNRRRKCTRTCLYLVIVLF